MPSRRVGRCPATTVESVATTWQVWVVLLEALPGENAMPPFMDAEAARSLLVAMGDVEGVALQCPDRVALQVRLAAPDPSRAMSTVLTRWREVTKTAGRVGWEIVRVEVMTKAEFEHALEAEAQ